MEKARSQRATKREARERQAKDVGKCECPMPTSLASNLSVPCPHGAMDLACAIGLRRTAISTTKVRRCPGVHQADVCAQR